MSPSLIEAIALLDDKPDGWRTALAELWKSGKLSGRDKKYLTFAN